MEVMHNQISSICELTEMEIVQVSGGDGGASPPQSHLPQPNGGGDKPPQSHVVQPNGHGDQPPQH